MLKIRYLLSVAETMKTEAKTHLWYAVEMELTQYYLVLKIKAKLILKVHFVDSK